MQIYSKSHEGRLRLALDKLCFFSVSFLYLGLFLNIVVFFHKKLMYFIINVTVHEEDIKFILKRCTGWPF